MSRFVTDLNPGESLNLDRGRIRVTLIEKAGQRARIQVDADSSVPIKKEGISAAKIAQMGIGRKVG